MPLIAPSPGSSPGATMSTSTRWDGLVTGLGNVFAESRQMGGGVMHDGKVLVYGATGAQGSPVVQQLLDAGRSVRVVTRDAGLAQHWASRGAEIAVGDLAQPETLKAANDGVDMVVLQLPLQYDFALHEAYGRNAVVGRVCDSQRVPAGG